MPRWASRRAGVAACLRSVLLCSAAGRRCPDELLRCAPILAAALAAPRTAAPLSQLLRGIDRHVQTLKVQVLPGSHWLQQESAGAVNAAMRAFLQAP